MGVILQCILAMHNEQNVKTAKCQSVRNFVSHVSAKYHYIELVHSWESYHKNKRLNFIGTLCRRFSMTNCRSLCLYQKSAFGLAVT